MPFCPNCKETFPKGIAICSKCNVPLTNETSVETVPVFALQREDAAQKFIEYMKEQGIDGSYRYSMRENAYKVYVDKPDVKKAVKLFASFYVMESKRRRGEDTNNTQADEQSTNGETTATNEESVNETPASQEDTAKEDSTDAPAEEVASTVSDETPEVHEEENIAEEPVQSDEVPAVEERVEENIVTEDIEAGSEEPSVFSSEIVSPAEEVEPSEPVNEAPSTSTRRQFRNLFIGRLRRNEENNPFTATPEPEAPIASEENKPEAIVEEADTPVEEVIETPAEIEENIDEVIEETAVEEVVEEAIAEIIDEPVEEVIEEITEEIPVEEVIEEIAEEAPVEEVIEEITEESPVEEVIEEIAEEAPVEEVIEEIAEEAPVEEVIEEITEEAPIEESVEAIIEETVEVAPVEQIIETVDDAVTAPFEYIPEPEETISDEVITEEAAVTVTEVPVEEAPAPESSIDNTSDSENPTEPIVEGSVIEEIIPDASLYRGDTSDYESVSLRPTDIQDTKIVVPLDYDIIEEVISSDNAIEADDIMSPGISSFADPTKAKDNNFRRASKNVRRYTADAGDLDSETFKAFVPDYTMPSAPEMDPEDETEKAFEEFKRRIKEKKNEQNRTNAEQQKERVRLANLAVDLGKGRKLIFEDTDDLDSYAGFVPDYTPNPDEMEAFEYYKPHSVSDYSRFKKSNRAAAAEFVSCMRLTSAEETMRLFFDNVPEGANRIINPSEVRTSNFILSMNGRQLILLFNSWMLLNISLATVKAFESEDASDEENFKRKIDGIKKRITDTFGDINESFLDNLVHKYYARYLDD